MSVSHETEPQGGGDRIDPLKADALVLLVGPGVRVGKDIFWCRFVRHFSGRIPVYVVCLEDGLGHLDVAYTPVGVTVVRVPSTLDASYTGRIARLLCREGYRRPVVVTDTLAALPFLEARYTALTTFLLRGEKAAGPWEDGSGDEKWALDWFRLLSRVDLVACPSEPARAWIDRLAQPLLQTVPLPSSVGEPRPVDETRGAQADPPSAGDLAMELLEDKENLPFEDAVEALGQAIERALDRQRDLVGDGVPRNVLVLYDDHETNIATLRDYLESFALYSRHSISYAPATHDAVPPDLSVYDAVVIHYSVRMCYPSYISLPYASALRQFGGYKILYMQDEYEVTERSRKWMEELGIHCLFTCVPEDFIDVVYPRTRFPSVDFVRVFTGYVPAHLEGERPFRPVRDRDVVLGYRGRALPYWYGDLGQDKMRIGVRMREICEERGVAVDIEWEYDKRLFGEAWFDFHRRCKAMLATESGANIFDDEGKLREVITAALAERPDLSYEEAFECYLRPHEGKVRMGQVSPRLFEAIALGTALVLFEGRYDDILEPGVHYIELKKDFSNVDEVLRCLLDDEYLEAMIERAYQHVVASGRYSYRRFISDFDDYLTRRTRRAGGREPVWALAGYEDDEGVIHVAEGCPRGTPFDRVLYLRQDEYEKEPLLFNAFRAFSDEVFEDAVPEIPMGEASESGSKSLYRIPGARWVDERICKPFSRAWERGRLRLLELILGAESNDSSAKTT